MAHAGAQTGVAIPDSGDPHFQADKQAASYLDNLELHQHTGAVGDYQQIPAAGLGVDGPVSWNDNELTDLLFAGFGSQDPAGLPDRAMAVDAAGDLYYKPPGAGAIQITAGGALNTTPGNGITGLAAPAEVTYTAGTGEYRFLQDSGTGLDATVKGLILRAKGFGSVGEVQLKSVGTSGAMVMTEAAGPRAFALRMPAGYNAAAVADVVASVPPEAVMTNIGLGTGIIAPGLEAAMIGSGSWTPTITNGVTGVTYTTQIGVWTRIGNLVFASFHLQWSAGTPAGALRVGPLPYGTNISFRGVNLPQTPTAGIARDTTLQLLHMSPDITDLSFTTAAGAGYTGTSTGTIKGSVIYMTS